MFDGLSHSAGASCLERSDAAERRSVSSSAYRLDAREVIASDRQSASGEVSLANIVKPIFSLMGAIHTGNGKRLGTCGLIGENLIMTARHVVEAIRINDLVVKFDHFEAAEEPRYQSSPTPLEGVVEDDPELDYAIIKLPAAAEKRSYVKLNLGECLPAGTVLLHYPRDEDLKVSVSTFDQQAPQHGHMARSAHDTDHCSSGGFHVDLRGCFAAMHLGKESAGDGEVNKYAIKLQEIVNRHPDSLLSNPLKEINASKNYLERYIRRFSIDEEGGESQKLFTNALGNKVRSDKKIIKTNAQTVSFSKKSLDYLTVSYRPIFNDVYNRCLYIAGYHSFTKLYSINNFVESDHLIPYDVWASTTLRSMKAVVKGTGKRPGENNMPAITIPYDKHRGLRTTGSSAVAIRFRAKLIKLCNDDKVHKVFIKCVKEYCREGINSTNDRVKAAINHCLDFYIDMRVIKRTDRAEVMNEAGLN